MPSSEDILWHLEKNFKWWYEGSVVESAIKFGKFKPGDFYIAYHLAVKRDSLRRCRDELNDLTSREKKLLEFLESAHINPDKGTS